MREAIGGTWLMYFFFIFIFIYVAFIAVIMNYASAYRTNNFIVSYVENFEGDMDDRWDAIKSEVRSKYAYNGDIGYCCSKGSNGAVYSVQTYVSFEIPLIVGNVDIPITTTSKTIYGGVCESINYCK